MKKVHQNLSLSDSKLAEIKGMKKAQALKAIEGFNLFGGYPTKYANEQNLAIYEEINAWKPKKEVGHASTSKDTKGNGKDNKE